MAEFESFNEHGRNGIIADGLSLTQEIPHQGSVGRGLVRQISARLGDADGMLGATTRFELVGDDGQQIQQDAEKGVRAMRGDALSGNGWSKDSIDTWKRVFQSEVALKGATSEDVADALNEVGAAINHMVGPDLAKQDGRRTEPVGMAIMKNGDGSFTYYMMLSKDDAALAKNRIDLATGAQNPNIIEVGTFKPVEKKAPVA